MEYRMWNRGRGPEQSEPGTGLGMRRLPSSDGADAYLRPGRRLPPGWDVQRRRGRDCIMDEEMGDLERNAKMLHLPENPIDVRRRSDANSIGTRKSGSGEVGGGGSGKGGSERPRLGPQMLEVDDAEDWNRSSFCPSQFHPKRSLCEIVQKKLDNFYAETTRLIGGRDGRPLDPLGYFTDLANDPTLEDAKLLFADPLINPR